MMLSVMNVLSNLIKIKIILIKKKVFLKIKQSTINAAL
jgi:hypothetical protein